MRADPRSDVVGSQHNHLNSRPAGLHCLLSRFTGATAGHISHDFLEDPTEANAPLHVANEERGEIMWVCFSDQTPTLRPRVVGEVRYSI